MRRDKAGNLFDSGETDQIPERGRPGARLKASVICGALTMAAGFKTVRINATAGAGGVSVLTSALPITNTIIAGDKVLASVHDITGTFVLGFDLVQITGTATISNAGGNLFGLDPLLSEAAG